MTRSGEQLPEAAARLRRRASGGSQCCAASGSPSVGGAVGLGPGVDLQFGTPGHFGDSSLLEQEAERIGGFAAQVVSSGLPGALILSHSWLDFLGGDLVEGSEEVGQVLWRTHDGLHRPKGVVRLLGCPLLGIPLVVEPRTFLLPCVAVRAHRATVVAVEPAHAHDDTRHQNGEGNDEGEDPLSGDGRRSRAGVGRSHGVTFP